jgi:serine protease Do
MRPRTRTIASFFTVAMAATLFGALVTTKVRRPGAAEGRTPESRALLAQAGRPGGGTLTLDTFREIAKARTAGVVNVNTRKLVRLPRSRDPFHEFFGDDLERFFGPDARERMRQTSLGSGFVIDDAGHILTNRHVIIEGADQVSVTFTSGKTYEATIVGRDARTDVALLKIDPSEPLTVLELGDSDALEVGEWVMAIGNPFGLGGNSVTVGVVSFKGRDLQLGVPGTSVDMIQTDAAINPGNSGGPLLDTRGRVVGINTMIVTDGMSRANAGVGFSVPINVARDILPQLRTKGRVDRGWLGVTIGPMSDDLARTYKLDEAAGAVVSSVTPGSPAEKAGLKPEDVILRADEHAIQDNGSLSRYIASRAPGSQVKLEVLRGTGGERQTLAVTLGTFPEDPTRTAALDEERQTELGMTVRGLTPGLAAAVNLPETTRGVVVTQIEPGGPADDSGLVRGDVIATVNGRPVADASEFEAAIEAARANGIARLRVLNQQRGNRVVSLRLK